MYGIREFVRRRERYEVGVPVLVVRRDIVGCIMAVSGGDGGGHNIRRAVKETGDRWTVKAMVLEA